MHEISHGILVFLVLCKNDKCLSWSRIQVLVPCKNSSSHVINSSKCLEQVCLTNRSRCHGVTFGDNFPKAFQFLPPPLRTMRTNIQD